MFFNLLELAGGSSSLAFLIEKMFYPGFQEDLKYLKIIRKIQSFVAPRLAKGNLLADIFEEKVKEKPDKTFIICNNKLYSYSFVDQQANRVARAAMEIGLKQDNVVAIMVYNEPAFLWLYLGLMKLGIRTALINFNLRSRSLAHCIQVSEANTLLVGEGDDLINAVTEILHELHGIDVYHLGNSTDWTHQVTSNFKSFHSLMESSSPAPVDRSVRNKVGPLNTCVYIYTSGTTGLPKPVIISHARVVGSGFSGQAYDMAEDDIIYICLPMYHSAALLLGIGNTITAGAAMVIRDKFSASHFWEDCRRHKVTLIQYIGEICRYLVARPKETLDGHHNIRVAFGNGLRPDIWTEFQTRFKIPRLLEFYGSTEGPIGFCNYSNIVGSCGRSSPFLRRMAQEVEFVKYDHHAQTAERDARGRCIPVEIGEVGLLIVPLIPGKTAFDGYKGKKESTEKKILRNVFQDGDIYFDTGDLMRVDNNYYLYFNDRVGDTFRWKGENVSTTEVSNVIAELDFIHDANVYGVTIPGCEGRAGMVAIHLKNPDLNRLTPSMLMALSKHCNSALPVYARPRFIRVQKELVLTATFKQQKVELIREGFDVTKIKDPLYYLNPTTNAYFPFDKTVYYQIISGNVPM
ncbi:hypothetical protein CHS0354_029291 [Potamilus streckersoni]|uniref:Very long-chain fatty acid transport protein n=1 Tax=Potamilus streckersoni TaxID=2493646 RepID=A0AAE0W5K1_9BIVA|nr:hypothetical protein CHS0354_029291 [Potamilus streckersoni]